MEIREAFVVHHKNAPVLARCLEAFARHAPEVAVTVLDTGGNAATAELLGHPPTGRARVRHRPTPNHSYAFAVNDAVRLGHGDLVLVTNADAFVGAGTVQALAAPFHDPRVAMTGPLARNDAGRRQRFGLLYDRWIRAVDGLGSGATVRVPWLAGHMVAIRTSAHVAVGGWDESLRFTNEDVDVGLRLRAEGWHCVLVGHDVVHLGGHATPDADRFVVEGLRGGLVVSRRHAPRTVTWLHRVGLYAFATARSSLAGPRRRRRWRAVARMARDGTIDRSPFGATLDDDA